MAGAMGLVPVFTPAAARQEEAERRRSPARDEGAGEERGDARRLPRDPPAPPRRRWPRAPPAPPHYWRAGAASRPPRDSGRPGSPTRSLRPSAFPPRLSLLPPPPVLPQRESQQSRGRRDISYLDFPYFLFLYLLEAASVDAVGNQGQTDDSHLKNRGKHANLKKKGQTYSCRYKRGQICNLPFFKVLWP